MAKNSVITVKILGDAKGLKGALGDAGTSVGNFSRTAVKSLTIAAGAFAVAGVAIGKSAVSAASDLNETISKTSAIFDDAADAVLAWSDQTAKSLGISKTEALDFASGFGGALKNIGGLSEEQAAKTAESLTQLTADLGSFFNASNQDVAAALGSALTGEFEPLKKYNVVINEALLKQKALELGLYDGVGALDAQAKQAATLALVYEQTADAQGDFERTSGGLANQQKILSARFNDLKAELGTKLLPIVTKFAGYLIDNMPEIERVSRQAFDTIGNVLDVVVPKLQQFGTVVKAVFDRVVGAFQGGEGSEGLSNVFAKLQAIVVAFVDIVSVIWEEWGDDIIKVITIVAETILPVINGALDIIQGAFEIVAGLVSGDWSRLWEGVKLVLSGAVKIIVAVVKGAFELVWTLIKAALSTAFDIVVSVGGDIVGWFKGLPGKILGALGDLGSILLGAGRDIMNGLWDGLKDVWGDIKGWFGDVTSWIPDLKGPMERDKQLLVANGRAIMGGLNTGLDDGFADTRKKLGQFTAEISAGVTQGPVSNMTVTINQPRQNLTELLNELPATRRMLAYA